jgi:hypothetical protein
MKTKTLIGNDMVVIRDYTRRSVIKECITFVTLLSAVLAVA